MSKNNNIYILCVLLFSGKRYIKWDQMFILMDFCDVAYSSITLFELIPCPVRFKGFLPIEFVKFGHCNFQSD